MIQIPDLINGIFEIFGGLFIALSCFKLYKDKQVRGVSWLHASFFAGWGYWNLYYYPSLGQTLSFWGGIGVVSMNTLWIVQMWYYSRKETKNE